MADEQNEYWNGPAAERWVAHQSELDRALAPFGAAALAQAAVEAGQRALDVGCGCGTTSLALAEQVTPTGTVVGLDISSGMLARARERASGVAQLSFMEGDAARFVAPLFDLVFSRFGVMFFAEPVAAFAHLRAQLRPAGRCVFVCWRALAENPWVQVPFEVVTRFVPAPEPTPIAAPGPFAFADRDRLAQTLSSAGFKRISIERFDSPVSLSTGGTPKDHDAAVRFAIQAGPAARLLVGASAELASDVRRAIGERLERHRTARGTSLDGSSWLVEACAC